MKLQIRKPKKNYLPSYLNIKLLKKSTKPPPSCEDTTDHHQEKCLHVLRDGAARPPFKEQ